MGLLQRGVVTLMYGLALGGPEGQKLTITNETRKVKNKTHSQVTSLQRKIIRIIKNKMK